MHPFFQHFLTITHHRHLVCSGCFRVGLYWQGLTHDLSKYSPTEFWVGVKYYQGFRSPNAAEREDKGYSMAWMHHKGRNRHHLEFWNDLSPVSHTYKPVEMPSKYLAEMVMDRIAACKTYQGKNYTDASPLAYLERANDSRIMHPETRKKLRYILMMLSKKGEAETFRFIRQILLPNMPFPYSMDDFL